MKRLDTVTFHEMGLEYYWHIPSGKVTNTYGRVVVPSGCYNLNVARAKVRAKRGIK